MNPHIKEGHIIFPFRDRDKNNFSNEKIDTISENEPSYTRADLDLAQRIELGIPYKIGPGELDELPATSDVLRRRAQRRVDAHLTRQGYQVVYLKDPETEADRLGQREKARMLAELQKLKLGESEELVLQRIVTNPNNSMQYQPVTLVLSRTGILRFVRNQTLEVNGRQIPVVSSEEIPLRDYPNYSDLVNRTISREQGLIIDHPLNKS